ncbi:YpdA family putative bacillithiol disulfide reductase [Pseudalkalibacillus hwajinpoensis]|uniref:YpdA family putative bacillithiol disulfide reductase n=1 Tax=Guptibacillus hwajinpoensis TaxID=208199 RepID=A0A4U1MHE0_9BACL|nr:YpdA family putative bacillithiol disulfide reductase [Pseudalkalibacillus hwajinpoensis]TKD69874.1 YpdA family putative bacillithiol disulfide reductase [Pseudalkalibacillus hwajinpoensis]
MRKEQVIIIGAGPCGMSAAIELMNEGYDPLLIEKGNIVNAIYHYPTHQTFFSSSEKLEIGDVPFIIEERKPKRNQALAYYRDVAKRKGLRIHSFEKANLIKKEEDGFVIHTEKVHESKNVTYHAKSLIIATGYYDSPNYMGVPGEELDKVLHYFKEPHPYFDQDIAVIGGKNSAVDAALELEKAGARVTILYRGADYSKSVKPWILPEFEALVRNNKVAMEFNASLIEVREKEIDYEVDGKKKTIPNDFVFAMTGYHPDHSFLTKIGIEIDEKSGRPTFDDKTMETNVEDCYIAGVIAAGNNANEIFIENGRLHGAMIANAIINKTKKPTE